jgi:hypothetical protein
LGNGRHAPIDVCCGNTTLYGRLWLFSDRRV